MLRKTFAAAIVLALFGCDSSSVSAPPTRPTTAPTASPTPAPTPTGTAAYVTPTFTFAKPGGLSSHGVVPAYISPSAKGVTVTLVSSSAGLSNVSASTDLTAPGVCSGSTCTVKGPPVPPGTDVFRVTLFDVPPVGTPPVEPSSANLLAQSSSSATPAVADPSFTIAAGANVSLAIALFGVPQVLSIANAGALTANTPSSLALPISVNDHAGNPITGQFAAPVTVTTSDASPQGTTLTLVNAAPGTASVVLNSAGDLALLNIAYGGLAEVAPSFTATATGGVTSGPITAVTIALKPIAITSPPGPSTQTANQIDLFAAPPATGSSATFAVSELGWSNAPYNRAFTTGAATCVAPATPAGVFVLSTTDHLTFTDTAPASPTAGKCSVPVTDFPGGQSATMTFTYTSGTITISGHRGSQSR